MGKGWDEGKGRGKWKTAKRGIHVLQADRLMIMFFFCRRG